MSAVRAFLMPATDTSARLTIDRGLDWATVVEKAEVHGLLPVLVRLIERTSPQGVPPAELERLRARFAGHEVRTLLLSRELLLLLELMEARSVPVIPFKGPVLAALLYGDPAMRRSDDLDLLIHEQDFWKTSEVLESRGYRRSPLIERRQMSAYRRTECDMSYVHPVSGMRVELHWAFVPPCRGVRIPAAQLWDRLGSTHLLGREVPVLSADDHLQVLCLHASKHVWQRLEWICGIAVLARNIQPPQWEGILREARSRGSERVLLLGLLLAHGLLGVELAAAVRSRIESMPAVTELAAEVRSRLFDEATQGFWRTTWFIMRFTDRAADRIRYGASRVLLPTYADLLWVRLPAPLSFFYFLLRPARLIAAWARAAFTSPLPRSSEGLNLPTGKGS